MASVRDAARSLPPFKPGNPISLTGSVVLNPGSQLPLNIDALRNPSKFPIAIHEIKFVAATSSDSSAAVTVDPVNFFPSGTSGSAPPASSSILEAGIQLGDQQITKTPVPVNLLGTRRSSTMEVLSLLANKEIEGGPVTYSIYGLANQVWRLDAPIILQGGQSLNVVLGHRSFYPYRLTAYVTLSGYFLPSVPKTMQLPYVSAFVPSAFVPTAVTETLSRISTEQDLVNDLSVPLKVKRFIGRVSVSAPSIGDGVPSLTDVMASVNSHYLTVNMKSASGVRTVRDDTPFENVFDAHTCAWECPHLMPPGFYWATQLKIPQTLVDRAVQIQILPAIALHGTREVRT